MEDVDPFGFAGINEDDFSPHPDPHVLFEHYNHVYFNGTLGACSVQWSSGRMTSCAGTCASSRGGGCVIKLSEPILKLRPPEDLKETLLHEMIHAFVFLQRLPGAGPDGHEGPFLTKMAEINRSRAPDIHRPPQGYNITVRHSMIDEVMHYRVHWWECDRCKHVIKRAMNRPPQEADCWKRRGSACTDSRCSYHMHIKHCGGTWIKVKEPERKKAPPRKRKEAPGAEGAPAGARAKPAPASGSVPFQGTPRFAASAPPSGAQPSGGSKITSFYQPVTPPRPPGAAAAGTPEAQAAPMRSAGLFIDLSSNSPRSMGPNAGAPPFAASGRGHAKHEGAQRAEAWAAARDHSGASASGRGPLDVADLEEVLESDRQRARPPPLPPATSPSRRARALLAHHRVAAKRSPRAEGAPLPPASASGALAEGPGSAPVAAAGSPAAAPASQQRSPSCIDMDFVEESRADRGAHAAGNLLRGLDLGTQTVNAVVSSDAVPQQSTCDVICIDSDSDPDASGDVLGGDVGTLTSTPGLSRPTEGAAVGGAQGPASHGAGDQAAAAAVRRAACAAAALRRSAPLRRQL